MGDTIRSREELFEIAGPIEDCDKCNGHNLSIDGLCVLHYAARAYTLGEIKEAYKEYEEHAKVRMKTKESSSRFRERAEEVFPDRSIFIRTPYKEIVDGQNIAWFTNKKRYGRRRGNVFHADTDCPHFPSGRLIAYPVPYARSRSGTRPCSHCTVEEGDS